MDTMILISKWNQVKSDAQIHWRRLTNDDLLVINGEKDKLVDKLQERYGHCRDDAEKLYEMWSISWR